jgi:hypothetical protein
VNGSGRAVNRDNARETPDIVSIEDLSLTSEEKEVITHPSLLRDGADPR